MKRLIICCAMSSVLAASFGPGGARADELIVNSYGGPYEAIIQERIIAPFEKQFGIKVIYDAAGSASQDYAKIKATKGRPGFDVVVMTASESLAGCKENLLEKLNVEAVPNLARLDRNVSAMAGQCGAVHEVQYMALLFRRDRIDKPLDSWQQLNSSELKGKIILPGIGNVMAVFLTQMMSVANGGSLTNLDPGFTAMAKMAPQTVAFEQSSAIMDKFMRGGRISAMPAWSGRAQLLKDEGLPIEYVIPKEGTIPLIATLNVPVGAPNKTAAFKFVNFFLDKARQEAWVTGYQVGSIREDLDIPAEIRARQITTKADLEKLHLPDLELVSEKLPVWSDRWKREVVAAAR
jgi:putative spermidine/putrescine transport system substrate-binding protein